MSMTLADIKAKLPPEMGPVVEQYGPGLAAMSTDQVWAWISLLVRGKWLDAYTAVVEKLPSGDLLAEWKKLNNDWTAANMQNVADIALQKSALLALLKVFLMMALAMVGL